ncbi:hypothetical protein PILCRDRAFT_810859 [Piloderma croceum F 1598]|uniref:Uncharacterized protein n=1 Tax=Piloderma croceum (strain F 1598) TaxID=765440 RepID=A0A0C3GIV9_PILCF|nr:hypothetical protein PILCRDRAFT_810859 [Piloderma croceum F 1598]
MKAVFYGGSRSDFLLDRRMSLSAQGGSRGTLIYDRGRSDSKAVSTVIAIARHKVHIWQRRRGARLAPGFALNWRDSICR